MKLLIVEDDKKLARSLRRMLSHSYKIELTYSGIDGLEKAQHRYYDVIILELGLSDINAGEICRQLRDESITTPILVLAADAGWVSGAKLLDMGADDYMTKPYQIGELQARLRALLRRPENLVAHSATLVVDDIVLDSARRTVTRSGQPIDLRRKEFEVLEYLLRHANHVVTREMLETAVWDHREDHYSNTVEVHIKYLRDKLDRPFEHQLIKTVHGIGYRLETAPLVEMAL